LFQIPITSPPAPRWWDYKNDWSSEDAEGRRGYRGNFVRDDKYIYCVLADYKNGYCYLYVQRAAEEQTWIENSREAE
jgi:hypothetical protein